MKFDDVVNELGEFGPYQKRVYFLVCFAQALVAMQILAGNFIQATPDHRCAIPGYPNDTYVTQGENHSQLLMTYIPFDNKTDEPVECKVYSQPRISELVLDTHSCEEYVYSTDPFESTFVSDTDLVCDDEIMVTYASMILMCGMLGGSLVLGMMSDFAGRKVTLVVSTLGLFVASFSVAWAESYVAFVLLRFMVSFFGTGMILVAYVIGLELVGPGKRRIAGMVIHFFWCVGMFVENGLAYALRDWRHLQMAISCPALLIALLFFALVPESPRWLLQRGKIEEAAKVIQMVARKNGAQLSEKARALEDVEVADKSEKIWSIFAHRVLLIRALIIFFNWFVASMVYYGLSLNVEDLSGDIYLNFFLSGLVEVICYAFCLALMDKAGRVLLQCLFMITGGVACTATLFPVIYGGADWITVVLSLVGKFGATGGFVVIYQITAELFPTVMRNSAMGLCSVCARIGGILAPYIGDLNDILGGDWGIALPLIIFGGLSVAAGLIIILLPETARKILPDTLEDAKNFGRSKTTDQSDVKKTATNGEIYGKNNPTFEFDGELGTKL